jgi:hypothetical protein
MMDNPTILFFSSYFNSIFTAFVLEAFLLEYETNEKTLFETKIEGRIIELGMSLDDENQR